MILTKTKKPHKPPRCEGVTAFGVRCTFRGTQYVNGRCVCWRHQFSMGNGRPTGKGLQTAFPARPILGLKRSENEPCS